MALKELYAPSNGPREMQSEETMLVIVPWGKKGLVEVRGNSRLGRRPGGAEGIPRR